MTYSDSDDAEAEIGVEQADGGLGDVDAPRAVFAARFATAGVAHDLGQGQVVDELGVPVEPEQAADGRAASAAGGADGEKRSLFAASQPGGPGGVGLAQESLGLGVRARRGVPRPETTRDTGVAEKVAVGDGGESPGAKKGSGPGAEEPRVGRRGGVRGVEFADEFIVAGEEVAGAEMTEAERFHVVITRENDAAVGVGLGEIGESLGDRGEGGFALPLGVDGVGVVAEKAEAGSLASGERDGAVHETDVLVDIGNDEDGAVWAKFEERSQLQAVA